MASQAPSSSSNPLARWLRPVSPTQQLLANQARLARAQASKKGQPAKQKNPVGRPKDEVMQMQNDVGIDATTQTEGGPSSAAGSVDQIMHDCVEAEPANVGNDAQQTPLYSDDTDELL